MNIHASLATLPQPRFLMCPPQHFAVTYSINPWMDPKAWADSGAELHATAARQWQGLHRALVRHGAAIETVAPEPGLPDLVFTANAAVVLDGKALLARFRHPERRGEEPAYASAFRALKARGLIGEIFEMPEGLALEGAGDCLWDAARGLFWMGCGFRSDAAASAVVEERFGVRCVPLALADPSFYHLDTAFCRAALRQRHLPSRRVHAGGACADRGAGRARRAHRARPIRCDALCRQCGVFRPRDRALEPAVRRCAQASSGAATPWCRRRCRPSCEAAARPAA